MHAACGSVEGSDIDAGAHVEHLVNNACWDDTTSMIAACRVLVNKRHF